MKAKPVDSSILPCFLALIFLRAASTNLLAADTPTESDYYTITPIETPKGAVIETAGIDILPDKKVVICTRRGQVWTVENAFDYPAKPTKWKIFAEYLHEPLSLTYNDGWLYAVQRPEVTRMKDEDGDGRADVFETVSDGWGISGNYHEYAFGSPMDKDGNIWCALCLTGSFTSEALYRGWIVRVSKKGKLDPVVSGVRSPGGVGFNAEGDVFFTDNQGAWNGSSALKWAKPGSFQGNPNGNIWYKYAKDTAGDRPPDPPYTEAGSRTSIERKHIPSYIPPAVILPHQKVGNSPTGIVADLSNGKFGPFARQVFVGEQTQSKINRVFLEKVNGIYQGAVFPFLQGFQSGNIGLRLTDDGVLFTGGSNRGWGARGGKLFDFERVNWTGKVPFEIHEIRAEKDGFELTFTKPVDKATALGTSFKTSAFTYIYQKAYGSPEVDTIHPKVRVATVAEDGKTIRLKVDPLVQGDVYQIQAEGLKSAADGESLLHDMGWYTLNEIPR